MTRDIGLTPGEGIRERAHPRTARDRAGGRGPRTGPPPRAVRTTVPVRPRIDPRPGGPHRGYRMVVYVDAPRRPGSRGTLPLPTLFQNRPAPLGGSVARSRGVDGPRAQGRDRLGSTGGRLVDDQALEARREDHGRRGGDPTPLPRNSSPGPGDGDVAATRCAAARPRLFAAQVGMVQVLFAFVETVQLQAPSRRTELAGRVATLFRSSANRSSVASETPPVRDVFGVCVGAMSAFSFITAAIRRACRTTGSSQPRPPPPPRRRRG